MAKNFHDLPHVARCFFYSRYSWKLGDAQSGLRVDIAPVLSGHIVNEDRDIDGFDDRFVMLIKTFLRRLIIVWGDGKYFIRTYRSCVLCQRDSFMRRIASRTNNNGNPARCLFDDDVHNVMMLGMIERRALTGCPARDQPVDTVGNLKIDECTKRSFIDGTVRNKHRRDKSSGDSFE